MPSSDPVGRQRFVVPAVAEHADGVFLCSHEVHEGIAIPEPGIQGNAQQPAFTDRRYLDLSDRLLAKRAVRGDQSHPTRALCHQGPAIRQELDVPWNVQSRGDDADFCVGGFVRASRPPLGGASPLAPGGVAVRCGAVAASRSEDSSVPPQPMRMESANSSNSARTTCRASSITKAPGQAD
jgi:hypothetical protein